MEAVQPMLTAGSVLGLLFAVLWWLRRRGIATMGLPKRGVRRLESVERLALGAQHVLHLVRYQDRMLLIAASPGGCVLLAAPEETAAARADGGPR